MGRDRVSRPARVVRGIVRTIVWSVLALVPYAVLWFGSWWAGPS